MARPVHHFVVLVLLMGLLHPACADFEIEVDMGPTSGTDAGQLTDAGGGADAGPVGDSNSGSDAGTDSGGADQPSLSNDECTGAIEASGGGTFSGDTCEASNTADFSCGEAGRPEVFYTISVPAGEWSCWVRYFNEGLTVSYGIKDGDRCPDMPGVCMGPTLADPQGVGGILFGGGVDGQTYWMAVESSVDGSCGFYTFTVECDDYH